MPYAKGDRVKLKQDQADVKKGAKGTVDQPVPNGQACWVDFDGRPAPLLVMENLLEPA